MQATPDFREHEEQDEKRITSEYFFVRSNLQLIRINWQDIYWIQAEGNYCSVVTIDKRFAVKTSLKKFLSKLPLPHFMQIHKAYIVNIRSIEKIDLKDSVVIIDGNYLPFGRIYRDTLLQQLEII